MAEYSFGPWNVLECDDYEYTCTSEQCLEDPFSPNENCECAPGFFRDCSCRCNALGESSFHFQNDCGCTNGIFYGTLGTCPVECPASEGETYCPEPYGSELDCSTIPDEDEDGDPIDGADIPKPSINKKWLFQISRDSQDSPIETAIDFGSSLAPGVYDVSNIFYADLQVSGLLNTTYILYAVINNQIRGISYNPVAINGISYHYLEVKWQQTQEEANQIILYAKNSSNQEVYLVDGIINPSGESIGDISTLITSLSWYS